MAHVIRLLLLGVIGTVLISPAAAAAGSPTPAGSSATGAHTQAAPASAEAPKAAAVPSEAAASAAQPTAAKPKKSFLEKVAPILILLVVVALVISRLPRVEGVNHSAAFRHRRVLNWVSLGLAYMLLYMGRYNLTVSKKAFGTMEHTGGSPMMSNEDFALIFSIGTVVYGFSFLLNGPLTDRLGGKAAILGGTGGAMVMNALMAIATWMLTSGGAGGQFIADHFFWIFAVLYAGNMYFQSFGAVAIVKCNAPWFHVRERGVFGAIFGILISLGIYLAYDVGGMIVAGLDLEWVFGIPAIALAALFVVCLMVVRNTPGEAGYADFETGSAETGGEALGAVGVFKLMFRNPVILTIAFVEACSGYLRQSIMQWYQTFAQQTDAVLHLKAGFVDANWGMLLCCAGILGGLVAGVISDHVFQSRRGPVAAVLYMGLLLGALVLTFTYNTPAVGWIVVVMSVFVIGVHGMLSGTASMDFGGKKNVGIAVGIIDGFVYGGTALMSLLYAWILPEASVDSTTGKLVGTATQPDNWVWWPVSMIPVALIGLILARRVWNAKPKSAAAAAH